MDDELEQLLINLKLRKLLQIIEHELAWAEEHGPSYRLPGGSVICCRLETRPAQICLIWKLGNLNCSTRRSMKSRNG